MSVQSTWYMKMLLSKLNGFLDNYYRLIIIKSRGGFHVTMVLITIKKDVVWAYWDHRHEI